MTPSPEPIRNAPVWAAGTGSARLCRMSRSHCRCLAHPSRRGGPWLPARTLRCTEHRDGEVPCAAPQETGLRIPHLPAELCSSTPRIPAGCTPAQFIPLCEQFQPSSTQWGRGNISMRCTPMAAVAFCCSRSWTLPGRPIAVQMGLPKSPGQRVKRGHSPLFGSVLFLLTKNVTQHALQYKPFVSINHRLLLFSCLLEDDPAALGLESHPTRYPTLQYCRCLSSPELEHPCMYSGQTRFF